MNSLSKKIFIALTIGIISALVVMFLNQFDFMQKIELMTLDFRYRLRNDIPIDDRLGYIEFDDDSIALYGKWPWSRSYQSFLVDLLHQYNTKAAGYDVFFVEKEGISLTPSQMRGANISDLHSILIDKDLQLSESIKKAKMIYLAYYAVDPSHHAVKKGLEGIIQETLNLKKEFSIHKQEAMNEIKKSFLPLPADAEKFMFKSVDLDPPVLQLLQGAKGTGFAQPAIDIDSIVRHYHLFKYYDNQTIYPITLSMISDVLDFKLESMEVILDSHVKIKNALTKDGNRQDIVIPIDKNFRMLVNWTGKYKERFLHLPFYHLMRFYAYELAKQVAREIKTTDFYKLKGKIFKTVDNKQLVSISDADNIATNIAAAQIAHSLALKNPDFNFIFHQLKPFVSTELATDIAVSVLQGLQTQYELQGSAKKINFNYPSAFAETAENAKKHLYWFVKNNKLHLASPYYFAKPVMVNNNGKLTPFLPIDLDGKIFMIGLTGEHTIDLNATPYEASVPMVSLHLNVLNNILTQRFLKKTPEYYQYLFAFILSITVSICAYFLPTFVAIVVVIFISIAYLSTYFAWSSNGIWFPWAIPIFNIILTYGVVVTLQFVQTYREKKKVKDIFSAMVSPSVLKVMEENPDKFSLTGERKKATMMFSKIDGISDVIKKLSPEELTKFLSIYLTPCSEIIMAFDGYIDKYEGHVIMADFGVPLDDPDNAWKCAFACILQLHDVEAFRSFVKLSYGLNVNVSIGFNHGFVSAGNMGSERKFQYTVMGDPVNVSARFMAANYIYNSCNAITGEDTVAAIQDYVYLRLLDKLLLKGKTVPIAIYDVLGWKPDAYLKVMKDKPIPEYLLMNWSYCPAKKLSGYQTYWQNAYKKTMHPLANKIAEFFASQRSLAMELASYEWQKEILVIIATISTHSSNNVLSKVSSFEDWIANTFENIKTNAAMHVVKDKLKIFELIAQRKSDDEFLSYAYEQIDKMLKNPLKDSIESVDKIINTKVTAYKKAVSSFYQSIKKHSLQYHEMMSLLCAPEDNELKSVQSFEQAFKLYLNRYWDAALIKLQEAEALTSNKNPIQAFMQRIADYKLLPPGENWQGEFVQTKK